MAIVETFHPVTKIERQGTPRAGAVVKAKIAHTASHGRSLHVFVPEPVQQSLGWTLGGKVAALISDDGRTLRLSPSHNGPLISKCYPRSNTGRIAVSGTFLPKGACAAVRPVGFEYCGSALDIFLPLEWCAMSDIRARAAKQTGEAVS